MTGMTWLAVEVFVVVFALMALSMWSMLMALDVSHLDREDCRIDNCPAVGRLDAGCGCGFDERL